jgi:predicted MFS family arabinose efflux permease
MNGNRWVALVLLCAARAAMGLQFQSVGSVGPQLTEHFGVELAALGALIGIYLLAGVFIAIPSGFVANRFGSKNLLIVALALMTLGGFFCAVSPNFTTMMFGRIVSGIGAVLLNVVVAKMVTDLYDESERSTAMAVLLSSWPLGVGFGLFLFGDIASTFGWRAVMYVVSIYCAANISLVAFFYPSAASAPAIVQASRRLARARWMTAIVVGGIWGIYNAGFTIIVSYLPVLWVEQGRELADATRQLSWLSWSLLLTVPLGGIISDRLGKPNLVIVIGLVLNAVCVTFLAIPALAIWGYFGVLVLAGLPAGAIMASAAVGVREEDRAAVMGIFYASYYMLMVVLPGAAGLAGDIADTARAPLVFSGVLLLVAAPVFAASQLYRRAHASARA